jgi:hypothetical protein
MAAPEPASARTEPRQRLRSARWIVGVALLPVALLFGLSLCIRVQPSCGPLLADGLRIVLGTEAVTCLEERVAGLRDTRKRLFAAGRKPRRLIDVENRGSSPRVPDRAAAPSASAHAATPESSLRPADLPALFPEVMAPGDGAWSPVDDPERPDAQILLWKTMLHPDGKRPWAELFVVSAPVERVRLFALPGTLEPETPSRRRADRLRAGTVPLAHQSLLLIAFNGGFKAVHGEHGMMVNGVVLLPPKPGLCTILGSRDGLVRIGTWSKLAPSSSASELEWWRQTPPCMYEQGVLHPGLRSDDAKSWGATLEGETVIRRSAIGLNSDQSRLYVGISNDTTARALAVGMHHAGAADVAQLDVNWSFPKILVFPRGSSGQLEARSLFKGFLARKGEYIQQPSARDFFYLIRRTE